MKTVVYTLFALTAFAGNSVLCRMALGEHLIDPAGFTTVRLLSGIVALVLLNLISVHKGPSFKSLVSPKIRHLKGALLLFAYASCFSYAYMYLETGMGALVLFGSVQLSLLGAGWFMGERFGLLGWFGVTLSFSGLAYLLTPTWGNPSLIGFVLMAISGLAWALYTLVGKGSNSPLKDTTQNFVWCLPILAVFTFFTLQSMMWTKSGLVLAVVSGAITSGLGYALWYAVLPKLSIFQAALIQLMVPVLAAIGGVLFVTEVYSLRLLLSSILVLGGIYSVLAASKTHPASK